jgi:hypothetical protein
VPTPPLGADASPGSSAAEATAAVAAAPPAWTIPNRSGVPAAIGVSCVGTAGAGVEVGTMPNRSVLPITSAGAPGVGVLDDTAGASGW